MKKSYKKILAQANQIQPRFKYPQALQSYLTALRSHFERDKAKMETENSIAGACSALYGVDVSATLEAYNMGASLGLTASDHGVRFSRKARDLDNSLKALGYSLDIECTNSINERTRLWQGLYI